MRASGSRVTFATYPEFKITDAYTGIDDEMEPNCYAYSIIMVEDYLGYRFYINSESNGTGGHGQIALHIESTHYFDPENDQTTFRIGVGNEGGDIPIAIAKLS